MDSRPDGETPLWEDDSNGRVIRMVIGPNGYVQMADADYLNALESTNRDAAVRYLSEAQRDFEKSWVLGECLYPGCLHPTSRDDHPSHGDSSNKVEDHGWRGPRVQQSSDAAVREQELRTALTDILPYLDYIDFDGTRGVPGDGSPRAWAKRRREDEARDAEFTEVLERATRLAALDRTTEVRNGN